MLDAGRFVNSGIPPQVVTLSYHCSGLHRPPAVWRASFVEPGQCLSLRAPYIAPIPTQSFEINRQPASPAGDCPSPALCEAATAACCLSCAQRLSSAMFGGGGFGGGGSGEVPKRGTVTAAGDNVAGNTPHYPSERETLPAAYFGQPACYQQWLPTQFAQFTLGGPYIQPHTPGSTGPVFYAPPRHAHPAAAAAAAAGAVGGSSAAEQQAFMAAHAHMALPMALPAEAAVPRGWGGMQLQEQQQRGGHGGARWAAGGTGQGSRALASCQTRHAGMLCMCLGSHVP